jgi:calcineurin-like phosphoesterase family protein
MASRGELGPFDWYTSDPHFNHKNIVGYESRPFGSTEDMNEAMVENWNSRVFPGDRVAVLGDFAFGSLASISEIVRRLNGNLTLVRGNHDRPGASMLGVGFESVVDSMLISVCGWPVLLSHYPPVHIKQKRYRERQPVLREGEVCLHGHCHGKKKVNKKAIHVGMDAWDYRPVSAWEVANLVEGVMGGAPKRDRLEAHTANVE